MKKGYKTAFIFLAAVLICLVLHLLWPRQKTEDPPDPPAQEPVSRQEEAPADPYQSPIDFDSLTAKNDDIYAWLDIPGTNISYPLLQSAEDDSFYLNHDENRKKRASGALYTEHQYNSKNFEDPAVVIYGHHMAGGKMFGDLQKYYTDDFEKYRDIIIYTPKEEIHYQVFAAAAFSNRHILYYYDCFKDELMMQEFLNDLSGVRAIGSYVDKDADVSSEDQLIVLSTCLRSDRTCRFLVVGKRID